MNIIVQGSVWWTTIVLRGGTNSPVHWFTCNIIFSPGLKIYVMSRKIICIFIRTAVRIQQSILAACYPPVAWGVCNWLPLWRDCAEISSNDELCARSQICHDRDGKPLLPGSVQTSTDPEAGYSSVLFYSHVCWLYCIWDTFILSKQFFVRVWLITILYWVPMYFVVIAQFSLSAFCGKTSCMELTGKETSIRWGLQGFVL